MTGCGACPDLTTYPAVSRDRTSANWTRKRSIYARSRLYVTAPSAWLMRRIEQSMLAPFVQRSRVIPNGVDVSVFRPAAKEDARRALGFETDVSMTLLVLGRRDVPWIDREMVGGVVGSIAARHSNRAIVVVVGDAPVSAIPADACVRRVPYQFDPNVLAQYYRAADVYVHCARAATFPATILEAMACGTPVVAVAAGGIVEQVRSPSLGDADADASTGLLVAEGDRDAMARAVSRVLDDCGLRARLGRNAIHDVRERFELGRQVDAYIDWYRTIIEHWNQHARAECDPTPALAGEPVRVAVD
jgi:glycosyltransferase involved in cell wall biosynthesis